MAYNSQYTGAEIDEGITLANSALQSSDVKDENGSATDVPISQNFVSNQITNISNSISDIVSGAIIVPRVVNSLTAGTAASSPNAVYLSNFNTSNITQFGSYVVPKKKLIASLSMSNSNNLSFFGITAGKMYQIIPKNGFPPIQFKATDQVSIDVLIAMASTSWGPCWGNWMSILYLASQEECYISLHKNTAGSYPAGNYGPFEIYEIIE